MDRFGSVAYQPVDNLANTRILAFVKIVKNYHEIRFKAKEFRNKVIEKSVDRCAGSCLGESTLNQVIGPRFDRRQQVDQKRNGIPVGLFKGQPRRPGPGTRKSFAPLC